MKRRIMIAMCLSLLCFGGCKSDNKSGVDSSNKEQQTIEGSEDEKVTATEVEPGTGEGTSPAELQELSDSLEYLKGETIPVSVEGKKYELTIDSASYLEQNDEELENGERIVVFDYTYQNLSDEPLLVGEIRFQLTDEKQEKVYEPYYFSQQKVAEPVEKGESASAQIAFTKVDENEKLMLVYTDISSENMDPILIKIGDIENK